VSRRQLGSFLEHAPERVEVTPVDSRGQLERDGIAVGQDQHRHQDYA